MSHQNMGNDVQVIGKSAPLFNWPWTRSVSFALSFSLFVCIISVTCRCPFMRFMSHACCHQHSLLSSPMPLLLALPLCGWGACARTLYFMIEVERTHNNFCLWKFYVRANNEYSGERWPANESEWVSLLLFFLINYMPSMMHLRPDFRYTLKFKRSMSLEGISFIAEIHELNDIFSSSSLLINLLHSNLLISRFERKLLHYSTIR